MRVADDAFEELFEREYPRLVRALRRADDDATDAVQEVADAMKLSEGTVKSQLHAARERLREMLTESSRG